MKIRLFLTAVIIVGLIAGYYFWSLKDKDLKLVPKDADAVVLIDVKNLKEQYFFSSLKHPSVWFGGSKIISKKNGLIIPDYIQIFHLKESAFSEWYSIFEIEDRNNLIEFLTKKGFKISRNNIYKKDEISVKIEALKCVVGFSDSEFEKKSNLILNSKTKKLYADQLINNSVASISYFAKSKIHKFAVYVNDDNIEIKTKTTDDVFSSVISDLKQQTQFLNLKLDSKNTKIATQLLDRELPDFININSINAFSELESVNDTIVSYAYDENFNEVEKMSYQKLIQPNYVISFQSSDSEKTWSYFQNKKWINAQNQFTPIPFQPNLTEQKGNQIVIKSLRKPIEAKQNVSGNYIFLKNSKLSENLLGSISKSGAKKISGLDYIFYGNKADYYYIKLQFKKEKLPIILR
jgi:hypothetical protein